MKFLTATTLLLAAGSAAALSMHMNNNNNNLKNHPMEHHHHQQGSMSVNSNNRRAFLSTAATNMVTIATTVTALPSLVNADGSELDVDADGFVTTESGLKYKVTKEPAEGAAMPQPGQTVKAHYTGWLDDFDSIRKFDSSRDRGRPFTFQVGKGQVIRGWDESFSSMKVGERRQIVIPPRLGYGDRGAGGVIPGGATLYFDVELLNIL